MPPAFGLHVLQGIWLNRDRADNRREVEAALELARKYPGTIKALIVGNETLLRGELPPAEIKAHLEEVRRRSGLPVTYADVWEFWLKAPELAAATDFVTIHILPYWEDEPVAREDAVAHVREVRDKLHAAFPGKEILIGEVGWPSQGRMREGALPSPVNQARFLSGVVAAAKAEAWKVNLIEAYDQPWKRLLEGTVGGYWGIYDDERREPKFRFGAPVSNHPDWRLKAGLGIGAAFLAFVAFWLGSRAAPARERRGGASWRSSASRSAPVSPSAWPRSTCRSRARCPATGCGAWPCWFSLWWCRWRRPLRWPRRPSCRVCRALDPSYWRASDRVAAVLAALLAATAVAAIHVALGLVFDPRYKDFPIAALLGPVTAFAILAFSSARPSRPGDAEIAAAAVLTGSAVFVTLNEGIANWQALVFAALLLLLALTVLRAKAAPG